jgi:hypothetical protein
VRVKEEGHVRKFAPESGLEGSAQGFNPDLCTERRRMVETWKTALDERNTGWKPMLLYAVASLARAHGDSFQDGSERALNSPENQCSIGFQPVFFAPSDVFQFKAF